ncbi:TIR domain-containing protein [Streptomyces sp. CB02613]|uniref:TIR domain-containing protein n=1 Tax=Streptomyces sp. CB02613 TaxID=2020328 RepID=UPI00131A8F2C|nr:TIR domain-containing protein [Streptomyces sp. CB02613]
MGIVRLVGAVDTMREKILTQITRGQELESLPKAAIVEVEKFKDEFFSWNEFTSTLLKNGFDVTGTMTLEPANEFGASDIEIFDIKFGTPKTAEYTKAAISKVIKEKLRVLRSIDQRLEIWAGSGSPTIKQDAGEAIFLVHGRDHESREAVRGFLERCTSRHVIVLDEEAGKGADILGKLLDHAQKASFAVILLTGDDRGCLAGESDLHPRARQNVILELGLFLGLLGRDKLTVLHEENVEIPGDYLGVSYVPLDSNKGWQIGLVRELRAAGINASLDALLG